MTEIVSAAIDLPVPDVCELIQPAGAELIEGRTNDEIRKDIIADKSALSTNGNSLNKSYSFNSATSAFFLVGLDGGGE